MGATFGDPKIQVIGSDDLVRRRAALSVVDGGWRGRVAAPLHLSLSFTE
ncbi:hypothetical protein [Streptomyces sp. NPDC051014]